MRRHLVTLVTALAVTTLAACGADSATPPTTVPTEQAPETTTAEDAAALAEAIDALPAIESSTTSPSSGDAELDALETDLAALETEAGQLDAVVGESPEEMVAP